jgi:hypothetical protein
MGLIRYIDPPSGWRYGFPKVFDWDSEKESFSNWLIRNGYPKEHVELAMQWSRYWDE